MSRGGSRHGLGLLAYLRRTLYSHLVVPFLQTHDRLPRVAAGASVGMFLGFTPTVGIQMYLATVLWILCRYGIRVRFNLAIALAMVWISNPVTMVPLYYLFLVSGQWLQGLLGEEVAVMSYAYFQQAMAGLAPAEGLTWLQWLFYAMEVLVLEFGWPLVLGSLLYAVPAAVVAYPVTFALLRQYRRFLADQQGISYAEWRQRYEQP